MSEQLASPEPASQDALPRDDHGFAQRLAPGDEGTANERCQPDPLRQAQAREYARIRRVWALVQLAFTLVLLLVFWLTGLSRSLTTFLWDLGARYRGLSSPWAVTALYFLILEIAGSALFFPLSWWTGFVLPHRYGLSTQTLGSWLVDQAKLLGIEVAFGVPVVVAIYWLLRTQLDTWWLWGASMMVVLSVILGALAPVLLVPIFYRLTPLEDAELISRIERLAERSGTRIAAVDTIDLSARTTAANALVMGLGATKRIALGDTLYETYSADEIETILAHELGHQVRHDLELGIAVQTLTTFAAFYVAHLTLQWGVVRFGFSGVDDLSAVPLVALVGILLALPALPLVNGFSRWRESLADRYALEITANPAAFATAMRKLMNQNLAEADPPRWVVWLLYDHPPIRARIEMAERHN